MIQVPGAEQDPALTVAIGIDGMQMITLLLIKRSLQTQTGADFKASDAVAFPTEGCFPSFTFICLLFLMLRLEMHLGDQIYLPPLGCPMVPGRKGSCPLSYLDYMLMNCLAVESLQHWLCD